MSDMGPSDFRRLTNAMEQAGFEIELNRSGHWQVSRDGKVVGNLPSGSGSDWRSWRNALAALKRNTGFEWRPKQPRRREHSTA
ncbi:hypothetical protein [Micromonospora maritima]|uniref:hypothetical protein n=1 Tax=Micromonospora maritima TaxID=986711 RepID=UPI001C2D37F8|nr:hypothetical protein [Micromonospora maritima]